MKQKIAIVGVGSTKMENNTSCGTPELYALASVQAVKDSGFRKEEIDGVITCGSLAQPIFTRAIALAESLGIEPRFAHDVDQGGASPIGAVILAQLAIRLKKARTILVAAADNITSIPTEEFLRLANKAINHPRFRETAEPGIPKLYDLWAEAYIEKYGKMRECLALVSVIMSRHASLHPRALNRKKLTLKEVLISPAIGSVTNVLECARPASGGGALIVTSEERIKSSENTPIFLLGSGEAHYRKYFQPNFDKPSCCKIAGELAFREAGVKVEDLDWAGIYDCFPVSVIRGLEDLGFCSPGEAGDYIKEGNIELGKAKCPVNTHGGLLSHGAPWGAPAIFSLIEAVEQLKGKAGKRQIKTPKIALVYANGGIFSSATIVILANEAQ